jgi:hypothetical protein
MSFILLRSAFGGLLDKFIPFSRKFTEKRNLEPHCSENDPIHFPTDLVHKIIFAYYFCILSISTVRLEVKRLLLVRAQQGARGSPKSSQFRKPLDLKGCMACDSCSLTIENFISNIFFSIPHYAGSLESFFYPENSVWS